MRNVLAAGVYPLEAARNGIIMPTILRIGRYRYFFFSNEGHEPRHVHVESQDGYAKLWLDPVRMAGSVGFSGTELRHIGRCVVENAEFFKEQWDAYFSGEV